MNPISVISIWNGNGEYGETSDSHSQTWSEWSSRANMPVRSDPNCPSTTVSLAFQGDGLPPPAAQQARYNRPALTRNAQTVDVGDCWIWADRRQHENARGKRLDDISL